MGSGAPNGDHLGVALLSAAHPLHGGDVTVEWLATIDPASFETLEIDIPVDAAPELAYAYSGLEFNDHFGPAARTNLARERADARATRKYARRARYMRRQRRV
jgi:hypothetical protein